MREAFGGASGHGAGKPRTPRGRFDGASDDSFEFPRRAERRLREIDEDRVRALRQRNPVDDRKTIGREVRRGNMARCGQAEALAEPGVHEERSVIGGRVRARDAGIARLERRSVADRIADRGAARQIERAEREARDRQPTRERALADALVDEGRRRDVEMDRGAPVAGAEFLAVLDEPFPVFRESRVSVPRAPIQVQAPPARSREVRRPFERLVTQEVLDDRHGVLALQPVCDRLTTLRIGHMGRDDPIDERTDRLQKPRRHGVGGDRFERGEDRFEHARREGRAARFRDHARVHLARRFAVMADECEIALEPLAQGRRDPPGVKLLARCDDRRLVDARVIEAQSPTELIRDMPRDKVERAEARLGLRVVELRHVVLDPRDERDVAREPRLDGRRIELVPVVVDEDDEIGTELIEFAQVRDGREARGRVGLDEEAGGVPRSLERENEIARGMAHERRVSRRRDEDAQGLGR